MRTRFLLIGIFSILLLTVACDKDEKTREADTKDIDLMITQNLLSSDFVGNGAQWGGYDNVQDWIGAETLSEADWTKLYERIDFMRPPFLRIMSNAGSSYNNNGTYDETTKTVSLFKMLAYAQSRHIEITYGEWGHHYLNGNIEEVDVSWIANSVKFLNHLVNEKGYTCIKTVNIINEPNGDWSTTEGNYNAWKNVQDAYVLEMANYNLSGVKLMGPDVAVFNSANQMDWITRSNADLGENIGLYNLHVYPKQLIVRNGDYTEMLQAYRDVTPADKRIVLGEIGFKYDEVDAELKAQNEAAIEADPYAGEDSNMMVYKAFYGIDMADALIQSMRAGFSGALVWNMDDAMYVSPDGSNYNVDQMKRWGFWNILGEEHCGDAEDEAIRPSFYPVSLLCRYFPAGSDIYNVELPNKKGVRAIMGAKDGKYSIAVVNSNYSTYSIVLKSDFIDNIEMNKFSFKSNADGSFVGKLDENGFATPVEKGMSIDLNKGVEITLEGESFILFTNMD
ncbi:hypothetical protein [Ancylomarina sp. 16SWW S1-10-2]|uniref:hypothetical protein n=1 Tax=Ancylomarina sp. 16SWW S1-10-2 TaxID=2499681 RepID=UPI0012AD9CF3|nr:hypothetical protein [Ancylomarina sp. 16SWW S1-10-2]MRT93711.1 hypothetical protein [Ancylomarina sp. 16SWW S1-10-2]